MFLSVDKFTNSINSAALTPKLPYRVELAQNNTTQEET
jgi:hypothetical protein